MRELEGYREALKNLPKQIQEAEAEAEKMVRTEVVVSGGASQGMEFCEKTELYIRATGEKTGMVYTEKLSMDPMEVIRKAYENSLEGETAEEMNSPERILAAVKAGQSGICPLQNGANQYRRNVQPEATEAEKHVPQMRGVDHGMAKQPPESTEAGKHVPQMGAVDHGMAKQPLESSAPAEVSAGELHAFARALEEEIRAGYPHAGSTSVRAAQVISTIGIVNSKGVDEWGTTCRFDVTVNVSYRENPMRVYEETVSKAALSDIHASHFIDQLKNWELSIRPAGTFHPGTYRAVLGSQAVNFLLVTGWKLFAANTYQSGGNPLAGRLSEKVFSDCITIRDYKNNGYPFLLDAEGTPSQDVTLVENGVFKGLMHNLATAGRAGGFSTGNAGRKALLSGNIHTDMTVVPKNFTMEAGEASLEELIQKCGDGIYIYESYDQFHSLNTVTGDFTFPCKGVLVKDGCLTGSVSGLSMNGNIVELLQKVELLGRDRKIEPMAMYENYLVSGPAMLVGELKVSG